MKKFVSLILCAGLLVLAGISTGCSLCCAPYDYCGPVYANGGCANLARMRCGTAFNGGCATCGMHGKVQELVNPNGQFISQGTPQVQPTPAPEVIPVPAPQTSPASSMIPGATQPLPAPTVQHPAQPQFQSASISQAPVMTADASSQELTPAQPIQAPINGSVAVDSSGYARVAVYDENNQLLGYEMVDSTGKSVNQVQAPASAQ